LAETIFLCAHSLAEDAPAGYWDQAEEGGTSIEQLRAVLTGSALASRIQRELVLAMFRDLLNQDTDVAVFLIANSQRILESLQPLVEDSATDISTAGWPSVGSWASASEPWGPLSSSGWHLSTLPKTTTTLLPKAGGKLTTDEANRAG
jgi:hypothetical protein